MKNPDSILVGELRQFGPNVEVWTGDTWMLYSNNSTLFITMCINFRLSLREIFSQATFKCPEDPDGYLKKQFEIAEIEMPSVFKRKSYYDRS